MDEKLKNDLQKLIAYQRKDIELKKLNNFIERDSALAEMNKQKKAFNDAKQTVADCESQSATVIAGVNELRKYVDDTEAAFAMIEGEEPESEEELAERVKKLESFRSKFQNAEKKAQDLNDKSGEIMRSRSDAVRTGKAAQATYTEAKAKHDELVASKAAELEKLKSELAAMSAQLDAKLFDEYKKLVAENKFPPIVPASGDDKKGMFNCGGCGLDLSQQSNTLVRDQGWCHCDTCHRIVYKF